MTEEEHTSSKVCSATLFTPRLPMQFISVDLIGPFNPSSDRYHYTLMVICMLTGYTFCVPLRTKTAVEVVQAYIDEVIC